MVSYLVVISTKTGNSRGTKSGKSGNSSNSEGTKSGNSEGFTF